MIYNPAEDSYLMSKVLEREISNKNIKILEIGSGSGIQLKTLEKLGVDKKNIFSCDINPKAVNKCKEIGFDCINSDLFENVKGEFDWVIFNPPYLPEDSKESRDSKISTTGGKFGSEIINRFLKQAKNFLKDRGKIFLITSSLTEGINWLDYKKKLLDEKKLFMEKLFVWKLKK